MKELLKYTVLGIVLISVLYFTSKIDFASASGSKGDVSYLVKPNSAEMRKAAEKIKEICSAGDNTTVQFSPRGVDGRVGDHFVVEYYCSSRFK